MTTASALAAYCSGNQERIDWLLGVRDTLIQTQFGTGGAVKSLINAGGNGSTAGFQIDLSAPGLLGHVSDALEALGVIPAAAAPVRTTYADFSCLQR